MKSYLAPGYMMPFQSIFAILVYTILRACDLQRKLTLSCSNLQDNYQAPDIVIGVICHFYYYLSLLLKIDTDNISLKKVILHSIKCQLPDYLRLLVLKLHKLNMNYVFNVS